VSEEAGKFTAELQSRKAELQLDPIPRTSPSCRAAFCGPGCALSPARFSHEALLVSHDPLAGTVVVNCAANNTQLVSGTLRWIDGPHAGIAMGILAQAGGALVLDTPIDSQLPSGLRAIVRQGCDRTLESCATRFANAINFQGEPFLPGNDLIARYPSPVQ
jgi:uncharacterized phage protein (TIGR02218 family)